MTGDSLGQVASQTPENLRVVSEIPEIPILRPLIGMDKIEITNEAQHIGTFDTSIEPDQDCCTLFVPRHPNTSCRPEQVQEIEAQFDVHHMAQDAITRMETSEFSIE